jgi:hypothetical protein
MENRIGLICKNDPRNGLFGIHYFALRVVFRHLKTSRQRMSSWAMILEKGEKNGLSG